nr:hypothetical protein [Tanacetum cinerariifolium]GEW87272.1 hypothetical protein [Tanacetum cinerariifolium]
MTAARPSNVVTRRAIDEIAEFSGETETPKYIKVFILQEIAEAKRFIKTLRDEAHGARSFLAHVNAIIVDIEAMDDHEEYFDSLMCLKDSRKIGNDKLMGLNERIAKAKEEISTLEAHL